MSTQIQEIKRKIVNLFLKLKETIDEGLEGVEIKGNFVVFYKTLWCHENVKEEVREIEIEGQKVRVKIEHTECVRYEEREEHAWLLPETETEKVVYRGTHIYVPLSDLKRIYGDQVEEAIRTLDIKKELESLREEEKKKKEEKEKEEYVLLNEQYVLYYYGKKPDVKGIKVGSHEEAINMPIIKEIERKYRLVSEEKYGDITVKEYAKDDAKVTIVDDKVVGWVVALRDDYYPLSQFIRKIITQIDELIEKGRGVYKGIGKFIRKEFDKDKIVYYFREDKGIRKHKILVVFALRDWHTYEVEVDVIWRRAEIPLSVISRFITAYIYDGRYEFVSRLL